MLAWIGILLVFGSVIGGYLLEHGNPYVLIQPAELLIIAGAASGIILVANPLAVIRKLGHGVMAALRPSSRTRQSFLSHLRMLYEVFAYAQRSGGIMNLETDVENPARSAVFKNHPEFLKDRHTREFICDSLRMLVIGATTPNELDMLMDLDLDVQRRGHHEPVIALSGIADALPGLGIVAAVLGVVITMQSLGGSAENIGQKVAAALVGTFLGILLCYGLIGPLATRLEAVGETQSQFLQVMRVAMVAYARGASPILAIEYARRSIPVELRPSFVEMEAAIKKEARIPAIPRPDAAGGGNSAEVEGAAQVA
jgi:chemotaxis protein MotA